MKENNTNKVSVVQINKENYKNIHANDEIVMIKDTGPKFGCRHVQVLLLFGGMLCGMNTRLNLSVAIVAMTDNTTSSNPNIPTYDWNNTSVVLSSFFWGYILLQVIAGYLGKTYGPKYFLLVFFFVNCCACALTPLAAQKFGSTGVMLCRIVQGFSQGFLFPSVNVFYGRWIPEQERTTLCNIIMSGVPLASVFAPLLTGYVSASWWGWPASFYILSVMGVCWCIIWLCFGQNSPATHPRITDEEKTYIQSSLRQLDDNINLPIPWMKIFTSVPFYALMAAQLGNCYGYATLMTETPTYLSKAMNFDVKSNALINALPSAATFFGGILTGRVSDWIISRNYLSKLNTRRTFNIIGNYGQALCLVWLSFLQPDQANMCIVVLVLVNYLTSFMLVGSAVNHVDLSPRFAGIIYGVVNALGQGVSLVGPLSANWIVTDTANVSQWQLVFLIAAGFFVAGGTIFFFFASASRQSWDGPEDTEHEKRRKKVSVISLAPSLN